jgi:hypothetical protein
MQILDPIRPDHPIYPFDSDLLKELMDTRPIEDVNSFIDARNKKIKLMEDDPLRHGVKLDHWKDTRNLLKQHNELLIMGGNRASKTISCVDYIVDTMINGPAWLDGREKQRRKEGLNIACLHSSAKSSIVQQQWEIYKYLPPEIRDMGKDKKNKHANVTFSRKTGFSDNVFILPNGNMCLFFNYNQEVGDLEGYEYDLVWCDELVPKAFVEALRFRLATRSGKLIVSFTPVQGFTPTVKMFVAGSVTRESRPADTKLFPDLVDVKGDLPKLVKDCPKGEMPYIADCRDESSAIIYYHSKMNPFNPYDEIVNRCAGKSSNDVKMRAYGYATRMDNGAFPKFGKPHVFTQKEWIDIQKQAGARFCVADPGGNKNWFIKWYFCTRGGEVHLYREWPDLQQYGEWAIPSDKIDFKQGPAQRVSFGNGIEGYKKLILGLEGWKYDDDTGIWDNSEAEVIEERLIDPRFSVDERFGEGTSIMHMMEDEQTDHQGRVVGPRMFWNQARGNASRGGMKPTEISIQMINELMDYNDEKPVNAMNHPRWFVHENCQQSIYAYQEYTGMGTEKDALKDIIDPDRYLVSSDVYFIDSSQMQCLGGGTY